MYHMKPTLVVLAAGMGSRYGGVKQIDAVGSHNECLLDYASYDAVQSGFGKIVYIIRPDIEKDFRERLFDRVAANCNAEYVFQTHESLLTPDQIVVSSERTKPWGTVHALLCAKDSVDTPFAIINADDFYGRESFSTIASYLSTLPCDSTNHAMVGYYLKNTMSKSGSVSRGICSVTGSKSAIPLLSKVEENLKIYWAPKGAEIDGKPIITENPKGVKTGLTGEEWVSMNLFGFTPAIFDHMTEYWNSFIALNAAHPKAEALLSTAVQDMIIREKGNMRVFGTHETWFGMTYPEDRPLVKQSIADKIAAGMYPEKLWDK